MLPDWMTNTDSYVPPAKSGTFLIKTINTIGQLLARIKVQSGHEKSRHLPAIVKLLVLLLLITFVSVTTNRIYVMGVIAVTLAYLCTWPANDILNIIKPSLGASLLALVIFIPAMIINPQGISNNIFVVIKVFISVMMVSIFNHTTQWNHVTKALRKMHVPGLFVFIIDITLKYLILLGNLICNMLTAYSLRAVGNDKNKYTSIGGIMGVTFLKGAQMNQEMYEAMVCRGFTDDYKGL